MNNQEAGLLQTVLETVIDGVVTIDEVGTIIVANSAIERIFGYHPQELVGKNVNILMPHPFHGEHDQYLTDYRATETRKIIGFARELSGRRKDGAEFPIDLTVGEACTENGRIFTGIIRDISGREPSQSPESRERIESLKALNVDLEKRLQDQAAALQQCNIDLQTAKAMAEMASGGKSAFLSRMSHELRTPMNAILGFGQLLGMTKLDKIQADSLSQIMKGGRHLLGLINDILEISRIESDSFGISLEPVDLMEIITDCIAFLKPTADTRGIKLKFAQTNLSVNADSLRLKQAILNLVSNGIKYNVENGSVTIEVAKESKGTISIHVCDTGVGVAPEDQDRLFIPFDRLGAESKNIEGTGLGLSLAKSLAEAMGGALSYHSEAGIGSTFTLTLPKAKRVAKVKMAPLIEPSIHVNPSGELIRILLIEDNLINVQLLQRVFSHRKDIEFVVAREGGLGLALAASHLPRLILLDLHLPDMPGREVLAELKQNPNLKDIPIIIVSADAYSAQREALLEAGAFRYITKPFELGNLIDAVNAGIKESLEYVKQS